MDKNRFRVLIVEDTEEDANVYRTFLCNNDECEYEFDVAETGEEARDLYGRRDYDCVLLDYHLPDIDGTKLLEQLKAASKGDRYGLPIVMITGRGDEKTAVRALKLGAADYILKSDLTPEGIYRATHNAIDKHRTARRLEREHEAFLREQRERIDAQQRELDALAEVKRERERLHSFFRQVPAPIAVLRGPRLIIEFFNDPMRNLTSSIVQSELQTLAQAFGGEIEDIAALVFRSGKRFVANEFEIERSWEPGEKSRLRYFNITFEPLREQGDTPVGVIMIMTDVTIQVNARHQIETSERRALESEDRFRQIAEVIPHMIFVANPDGGAVYFNSTFLLYTGTSLDENIGQSWLKAVHPEDRETVIEIWERAIMGGTQFETTFRLRRGSDGTYRWFIARALPLKNDRGEIIKLYGSAADIHEQRVLNEEVRNSENRLLMATQASQVGIWEMDYESRRIWRNLEHDRAFGYANPVPRWTIESVFEHALPEDRAKVEETVNDALRDQRGFDLEFRVVWPNQTVHWLHARSQSGRSPNGRMRLNGTIIDITDRKNREQELSDAKSVAEAANQTKTAFLANMSHEIRTPLSAIMGFTELISSESLDPDERRSFTETVQRNGRALMQIIDDILDLSKIEAGKLELDFERTDIRGTINDVVLLFRAKAEQKDLRLFATFKGDLPRFMRTDPTRFRQILMNAVSNAIKFTEKGSVEIIAEHSGSVKGSQGWLVVSIKDTGIGIPEEHQMRLFQPFSQGDNSMTRKFGGTGLGLMLSRRLAKLLGGAYYLARSTPEAGSAFELRIPMQTIEAEENERDGYTRSEPVVNRANRLQGVRILLVDDSNDSRMLAKRYLEKQGAIVEAMENAREALELSSQSEFDIVITDIQMPIMNGYDFTRGLRDRGFRKPVIGLTAHVFKEDRKRSYDAGLDDHLGKPFTANDLINTVLQRVESGGLRPQAVYHSKVESKP